MVHFTNLHEKGGREGGKERRRKEGREGGKEERREGGMEGGREGEKWKGRREGRRLPCQVPSWEVVHSSTEMRV